MPKKVKKVLHICIILTILVAIGFVALVIILRYDENGESNMPFEVSKITVISTSDAQDVEDSENRWNERILQNNDIYIDIKKNDNYDKTEIIEKIVLNNFKVIEEPLKGGLVIYRPSTNELKTFENSIEFEASEIVITGGQSTDIQNLQISNQGGRIAFRCSNEFLGSYISNEEEELDYSKLLEKMGISYEDLKAKISFDIEIFLEDKKSFRATIDVDIPVEGVVADKSSKEITDIEAIFKRTEN